MTESEKELMIRLTLSLDTCMELVVAAAAKESRQNEGKKMREITWEKRTVAFDRLLAEADDHFGGVIEMITEGAD